jgi:hypothetical protein
VIQFNPFSQLLVGYVDYLPYGSHLHNSAIQVVAHGGGCSTNKCFPEGCRGTEGDGDGKGDGLGVVPGPVPGPHPRSDKELGLIPASKCHCTAGSRVDFALAE